MPATPFLFDGNIYNKIELDTRLRERIKTLVERGRIEIVASPVVVRELKDSPWGGVPAWFPVVVRPERIAISGLARSGMATSSKGVMYSQLKGASNKGYDAIMAHSAHSMGATLVSEDGRCRERLKRLANSNSAMSYAEFAAWLFDPRTSESTMSDREPFYSPFHRRSPASSGPPSRCLSSCERMVRPCRASFAFIARVTDGRRCSSNAAS